MATQKDDPRLKSYTAATRAGVKSLTRWAARSEASRMAPKTHWEERWIGVIRGYPKTAEAFVARQERGRAVFARLRAEGRAPTRQGIPDGWRGRRAEIAEIKAAASLKAREIIAKLIADGILSIDEDAGNGALQVAFEIMLDETVKTQTRLSAAAIITTYTKAKPRQPVETIVSPAEVWLAALHTGGKVSEEG